MPHNQPLLIVVIVILLSLSDLTTIYTHSTVITLRYAIVYMLDEKIPANPF
jgi:hypothetical protein